MIKSSEPIPANIGRHRLHIALCVLLNVALPLGLYYLRAAGVGIYLALLINARYPQGWRCFQCCIVGAPTGWPASWP